MQREHAQPSHAQAEDIPKPAHAPGAAHAPKITTHGEIPGVAADHGAAAHRPSASELAYGGGATAHATTSTPATATPEHAAPDATKEPFIAGDIMYEQLAHRFAYRDSLSAEDRAWLRNQGFEALPPIHGKKGLAMMAFVPLPGFEDKRRPVLAFAGSNDVKDALDDFNAHGVGASQMAENEGTIGKTLLALEAYGKAPCVTGHSLGGALAQMAASRFPDLVAKVVTFQSPGISKKMADDVDPKKTYSHHYQVKGDVVGTSGEALTPGDVTQIERPTGYLVKHTGYVTDYAAQNPDKEKQVAAGDRKVGKSESLRAGFGKFLGAIQKLTHTGDADYIETWEKVRDAVDQHADPTKIRAIIEHSKLSADDKKYAEQQLTDVLEARAYENHRAPETDHSAE
jgi:hypothetical protein